MIWTTLSHDRNSPYAWHPEELTLLDMSLVEALKNRTAMSPGPSWMSVRAVRCMMHLQKNRNGCISFAVTHPFTYESALSTSLESIPNLTGRRVPAIVRSD